MSKAFKLSDNDLDLISELLSIASVSLHDTIGILENRNPGATVIDSLERQMSQAADIRARIEAR